MLLFVFVTTPSAQCQNHTTNCETIKFPKLKGIQKLLHVWWSEHGYQHGYTFLPDNPGRLDICKCMITHWDCLCYLLEHTNFDQISWIFIKYFIVFPCNRHGYMNLVTRHHSLVSCMIISLSGWSSPECLLLPSSADMVAWIELAEGDLVAIIVNPPEGEVWYLCILSNGTECIVTQIGDDIAGYASA